MARPLKDICKDEKILEIIKQYEAAKRFWLCSPGDDDELERRRMAFAATYSDDLEELYQAAYYGKEASSQQTEETLNKYGVQELLKDYHHMKQEQIHQDPLNDPSITDEQRKSLKEFHKWLYRNCEKTGAQFLGSDGTMRNLAEDFMSRPAREQLKALYLLETDKRKKPSEIKGDDLSKFDPGSKDTYVPDLENLKEKMIATKWKFWKRRNGSHLYWEKLQDALNQAGNQNHPINGKQRDLENLNDVKKSLEEEGIEDAEEASAGEKFDEAVESYSDMVEENFVTRGLDQHGNAADIVKQVFNKSYSGVMEEAATWMGVTGSGLHALGSVARAVSDAKALGWGVKARAGEKIGQGVSLLSDITDASSYSNDIVSFFVEEGTKIGNNVKFAGSILGTAVGSVYTIKTIVDLSNQGTRFSDAKKAEKIGRENNDEFLQKTGRLRKRQLTKEIGSTVITGIEGLAWLGGGICTFLAAPIASLAMPIAGVTAAAVGISRDIYEGAMNQKMYRDTVDTYLFNEGKDLQAQDERLLNKLNERKKRYPKNSREYKYLNELGKDSSAAKAKRYDILRRDKLKKEQCCSLRGYHNKAMDQVGEKILAKCFKDANGNLMSREQKEDLMKNPRSHTTQERIQIGYKELAKSFGINTKMASSRKLQKEEYRKKEERKIRERIQEGMHR